MTYPLGDFIDYLLEEAIEQRHRTYYPADDYDDDDSWLDNSWQDNMKHALHNLKLSKRELGYLCADAIENLGALDCVWCGVNTSKIGEYYMVNDDLWERYGCVHGCACIGCLETSMGRRLEPTDFKTLPSDHMSDRLCDRLGIGVLFNLTEPTPQP